MTLEEFTSLRPGQVVWAKPDKMLVEVQKMSDSPARWVAVVIYSARGRLLPMRWVMSTPNQYELVRSNTKGREE